jgi:hypothetical protein
VVLYIDAAAWMSRHEREPGLLHVPALAKLLRPSYEVVSILRSISRMSVSRFLLRCS